MLSHSFLHIFIFSSTILSTQLVSSIVLNGKLAIFPTWKFTVGANKDKNLKVSLENFEQAKTHPDEKDKKDLIEKIQKLNLT